MSYTPYEYINTIIHMAIENGYLTRDEVEVIVSKHGSVEDFLIIDILSKVARRSTDSYKTLNLMQSIYRNHKNGLK